MFLTLLQSECDHPLFIIHCIIGWCKDLAAYIRHGPERYGRTVRQDNPARDAVDLFDRTRNGAVLAAALSFVGQEIGDPDLRALLALEQPAHFVVQPVALALRQVVLLVGLTGGLPDGGIVARQRGKGSELRRTVVERHLRVPLRHMVRQVDDIVVGRFHALCPPICSLRSLPVAPSSKFSPFNMAFLPNCFLISAPPPAPSAPSPARHPPLPAASLRRRYP